MPLSAPAIKAAEPKDKDYKLSDEKGLFLLVKKNESKCWRMKYRVAGKEKMLAPGHLSICDPCTSQKKA